MDKNDRIEKNERNSNVILLIVIAIATMVIVVVGATFAYLASVTDESDTSNINAVTEGSKDFLMLDAGGDLDLNVTFDGFGQNEGDAVDSTVASVRLSSAQEANYKYRMFLEIGYNDFEYTSGSCYQVSEPVPESTTREACLNDTNNLWARAAGSNTYACYGPSENKILDAEYSDNELQCGTRGNTMWAQDIVPELVLDIYSGVAEENAANCVANDTDDATTLGTCVNSTGRVLEGLTKSACKSTVGNYWIPNVHRTGMCFRFLKRMDITTAITGPEEKILILDQMEINAAANTPASHYYLAEARMINLNHNQIMNGGKRFTGNLTLSVINDEVPEVTE